MIREGVMMVLFDLAQTADGEKRAYREFRRQLLQCGYMQLQESVYIKHLRNVANSEREKAFLASISPNTGQVLALGLTRSQFETMENVSPIGVDPREFCKPVLFF